MDCGKITAGFTAGACGKLPIGGTGTRVVVLNYADIDKESSTLDPETGIISKIALKSGEVGFLYQSIENSSEGSATFSRGTYTSGYQHSNTLRIFKDEAEARAWVNSMKDARLVTILEKRQSGAAKWEVYGWESGMKLSENSYSTAYADHVVVAPVISSDDESIESDMPYIFYSTSEEATEEAVLALTQS